jgi:hypothetical protein
VIAALAKEVRDEVNRKLEAGVRYAQVCAWLVEQGHAGITEGHMMRWYHGGFVDWKREQERMEQVRVKREFALDFLKQNEGGTFQEASLQLAAAQLYDMLCEFDARTLKQMVLEKPELYVRMINSLSRLSRGALDIETLKQRIRDRLGESAKKGGLSDETIRKMEEALNLL